MAKLTVIKTPDGHWVIFAAALERFIQEHYVQQYSSMDCNGDSHPGTMLNAIAEKLYSPQYMKVFNLQPEDWMQIDDNCKVNHQFIQDMIQQKHTTRRAVQRGKLDCYSFDFALAVIAFVKADKNIQVEFAKLNIVPYAVQPVFTCKPYKKCSTAAKRLLEVAPAKKPSRAWAKKTVISTFDEETQAAIREYEKRVKLTRPDRKTRRKSTDGQIGCLDKGLQQTV